MSEEIPSDGVYKPRSALGDVTNQVGKRGFSLVSTPSVKSGDGCRKDEGFQSAKKECLRLDNSKKENFQTENSEYVLLPPSCNETNSLKGNSIVSKSKIPCEINEPCSPDGKKSTTSSSLKEAEEDERTDSVFVSQNASKEKVENSLEMDDGDDACVDNLYSSKDEFLDYSKFPESQESRCGLERCIGQKSDGLSNMCIDSIKDCSCSFCTKAAYLWSDLHYQDIKGRIAAIKKSQKEASILVDQNNREGAIGKYGEGNSEKVSNLETDLTGRWMSLFLHMEDMFVREGSQLETSLSILKELRDNCNADSQEQ